MAMGDFVIRKGGWVYIYPWLSTAIRVLSRARREFDRNVRAGPHGIDSAACLYPLRCRAARLHRKTFAQMEMVLAVSTVVVPSAADVAAEFSADRGRNRTSPSAPAAA